MRLRAFKELAHTIKEANSAKSTGQASRLEIHVGDNVVVLLGQAKGLKAQAGFQCCNLDAEFLLLQETSVFWS